MISFLLNCFKKTLPEYNNFKKCTVDMIRHGMIFTRTPMYAIVDFAIALDVEFTADLAGVLCF